MANKMETIELTIPSKSIHICNARCSNGCDLMDNEIHISGYASIRVNVEYKGQVGLLNLDPVYGSYNNISDIDLPVGNIVKLSCPSCGVSLQSEDDICSICSSPMFILHLPHGSVVEGCLRNGCMNHELSLVNSEELMKRLFDDRLLDTYL